MRPETLAMLKSLLENSMYQCAVISSGLEVLWSGCGNISGRISPQDLAVYTRAGYPCSLPVSEECFAVLSVKDKITALAINPVCENGETDPCGYVLRQISPVELFGGRVTPGRNISEMRRYTAGIVANMTMLRTALEGKELYDECSYISAAESNCYKLLAGTINSAQINRFFTGSGKRTDGSASAAVQSIIEVCRLKFGDTVKFNVDIQPNVTLFADFEKFSSVVINLIINSYLYNISEIKEIGVSLTQREGIVTLVVEDNGEGIPGEVLDRICSEDREYNILEGSKEGLGLAIVKLFAKEYDGELSIVSKGTESGTIVRLKFPVPYNDQPEFRSSRAEYMANKFSTLYVTLAKAVDM